MNLQTAVGGTILIVSTLISACANQEMVSSHSGFLKSYDGLKKVKNLEETHSRVTPGADFSNYENIMVAPFAIIHGVDKADATPEQQKLFEDISTYMTEGYKKEILKNGLYNLVEKEGPSTIRVEAAVSAVEVHFDDLEWYQYIPVSLAVKGISQATYENKSVRVLAEARIVDTQTKEVLVRRVTLETGLEVPDSKSRLEFKDVKPALDVWLGRADHQLTIMHSGKEISSN